MMKRDLKRGNKFKKSVLCLTHFHNSCLPPQHNYNAINFVNNNYIFHDIILSKGKIQKHYHNTPH